ncbi:hypothetical protein BVY03_04090 [bacterium K02(2017)]|nr:hypothetical protein BVY03_04090 [bacterium K02(2017)]
MSKIKFVILFILNALFWGASFLAIHYSINVFSPFFAAQLRVIIALLFIFILILFEKKKSFKHPYWFQSCLLGILSIGLPWALLFWGETIVSPAVAAILNSSVPVLVVLMAPLMTPKDGFSVKKLIGVCFGFIGIACVFFPDLKFGKMTLYTQGMIAIMLMAISYAIGILWTRRISKHLDNQLNLFYNLLGSVLFLNVMIIIQNQPVIINPITPQSVFAVLYLGIFSSALALLIFFKIIKEVGSVQASAVTFMVPLIAIVLDLIFLGKGLNYFQSLGAGFIFVSLFIINHQTKKSKNIIAKDS